MIATPANRRSRHGAATLWLAGLGILVLYVLAVLHLATGLRRDSSDANAIRDASRGKAEASSLSQSSMDHLQRLGIDPSVRPLPPKALAFAEDLRLAASRRKLAIAAIHLVVFIALAWLLVWPFGREFLTARSASIEQDLQEARSEHRSAERASADFEGRLGGFEGEVRRIREEEKERGRREAEAILASAGRTATGVEAGCDDCMARSVHDARNALKADLAAAVFEATREKLAAHLDDDEKERFIERGIDGIEEATWTSS